VSSFVPVASALSIACLAISMAAMSGSGALAQAKNQMAPAQAAPPPQQAPQIKQMCVDRQAGRGPYCGDQEMDPITAKIPQDCQSGSEIAAQLEGIANKNGFFASYDDYNNVVDNNQFGARWLRSRDQEICRVGMPSSRRRLAQGPGRQENVRQGQEGCAGRPQRGAEYPAPAIENKGNIDLVTNITTSSPTSSAIATSNKLSPIDEIKKAPDRSPGLFLSSLQRQVRGAHPHHEAVVAELCDLVPGQRLVAERRQACIHLAEVRIGLGKIRVDFVRGACSRPPALLRERLQDRAGYQQALSNAGGLT